MGNSLRDRTAASVRGLPCLDRFVLVLAATLADDSSGDFYAALSTLADLAGVDRTVVRRIVRRYEGRPLGAEGRGPNLLGMEPGKYLYPQDREARQGDGRPTKYTLAPPAVRPLTPKRKAKNPCGNNRTGVSHTRGMGGYPIPTSETSAEGLTGVSHTRDGGMGIIPTGVSHTHELVNYMNSGGRAPLPTPPEGSEEGRGGTPAQPSPPATPTPTPAEAMRARAEALRRKAQEALAAEQGQRGEIGDETITPPSADEPAA